MTWQNNLEQGMQVPGLTVAQLALIAGQAHTIHDGKRDRYIKFVSDNLRGAVEITDKIVWNAVAEGCRRYGRA